MKIDSWNRDRTRRVLSMTGGGVLGLVLIVAAVGKLFEPIVFVEQIRNEGLEGFFSAGMIALIALALEIGLGMALLLGIRSLWVLVPSACLVGFFVFLTSRSYWLVLTGQRENTYDCGCFGVFLERTASQAFWQDLFLLVPPLVLAFLYRQASWAALSKWKPLVSVAGALAIVLYTLFGLGIPMDSSLDPGQRTGSDATTFRLSTQFALYVDGREDKEAEILESEVALQFLVLATLLEDSLVLDIRSSRILVLDSVLPKPNEAGEILLPSNQQSQEAGEFEVRPDGLSFDYQGHSIQIRNRS